MIKVGDKAYLPTWYKSRKCQRRTCIVIGVFSEKGREYILLAGMLKNGKPSKDFRQQVYWHIKNWKHLIRLEKK